MSSLVYPSSATLPGITYNSIRAPSFKTGIQTALSGKESRIQYQQYPIMTWTLIYELLRDYVTPSEYKALNGLFMQLAGQWDTCLYTDPLFNTVTAMQFGTGDGTTTTFQVTAVYENTGGPGTNELIQNFNGTPTILVNGVSQTLGVAYTISGSGIVTFLAGHIPGAAAVIAWTGAFYYRVRFEDDSLDFTQFMNQFWEVKKVKLRQVKL
jgi:uncharacterized protein (TIGR02217 family)